MLSTYVCLKFLMYFQCFQCCETYKISLPCCVWGITGSYVDYTGTSTSNKSDANMEHSDSQGSNDTIKITPQFAPHFKPKVNQFFIRLHFDQNHWNVICNNRYRWSYRRKKTWSRQASVVKVFFCFFQGDPLRTLPLSRGGSVESLPARTQCLASSDSKRMSADLSELEPKIPFTPAGNARHYTVQNNTWKQSRIGTYQGKLACSMLYYDFWIFYLIRKVAQERHAVLLQSIPVGLRPFHKKLLPWHLSQVLFWCAFITLRWRLIPHIITSICPWTLMPVRPSCQPSPFL